MPDLRSLSVLFSFLLAGSLAVLAQDATPPVAPPADTNLAPPVAQPVAPPVTPVDLGTPAAPSAPAAETNLAPPVAQPVAPPVTPVDLGTPAATNPAPATASNLVILNPAATRFDSAMALFNAGNYADAVTALSDFVRDFPGDRRREEALYRLAESYRNLGRTADALAAYAFEVQAYPDGPLRISADLKRGAILFDAGKFAEAAAPLQEVASQGPPELQEPAIYLLGRCLLVTGKEPDGRAMLDKIIDAQPPGKYAGDAAQALAELDGTQNHPAEALAYWQKALALTTDHAAKATIAARGGWSALTAGQLDAAEKLFQTTRRLDPSGDAGKVANTGLLRILFQQKRYPEWLATYDAEKDRLLDSARSELLYDLGHTQFMLKHWAESAAAYDQYLRDFRAEPSAVTAAYERFLAGAQLDPSKTVADAQAYLQAWPRSPYRARVQLVEAQELSSSQKFAEALPLWEHLSRQPADADWPRQDILLQLARAYDHLKQWAAAATAYQSYLDDVLVHPSHLGKEAIQRSLDAQGRLAVCLQNDGQYLAAIEAWKTLQSRAPDWLPGQQMALEALGVLYAKGGPVQENDMVETFRTLLEKFPQSPLRALAAFSVGDSLFNHRDYAIAEPYLLEARDWDATAWMQPATERLVLGAYGMKDPAKAAAYLKEYDTLPVPADPQARLAARLPAALFYWLGETARKAGRWEEAEADYTRVTQHPDPGDLLAGAWWQLGQVQAARQEWAAAVSSDEKYRDLKPDAKDATVVLLALGRAQLGAGHTDAAKVLGQQALLQEPEGPNSAAARTLLAETAFASRSYPEAARMFATLAVLFDDPKITPQAMSRAADAFELAGDAKSAADWRQKVQTRYPGFQPVSYL
jgi:tetratricopeptide (TPR) repeat protein